MISKQCRLLVVNVLDARTTCSSCFRAESLCLCHWIKPFHSTAARFVILLHPKEARRTIGTARIVRLCMPETVVIQGKGQDFDQDPRLEALLKDPTCQPLLLFPGPKAMPLSPAADSGRRPLVFLIDGTWPQAKKMLATSARLQSIPQVRLSGTRRSDYRFRRQPAPHCLSTVEAVHQVIEELRPVLPNSSEGPEANLLTVFRQLVDSQLLSAEKGVATRPQC